jgi:hypothetical protein
MKPEGSLLCWQVPATGPYQLQPVHSFPPFSPKINSNIKTPSTLSYSEWSLPFRFANQILSAFLTSPMPATYHTNINLLDLITLIIDF